MAPNQPGDTMSTTPEQRAEWRSMLGHNWLGDGPWIRVVKEAPFESIAFIKAMHDAIPDLIADLEAAEKRTGSLQGWTHRPSSSGNSRRVHEHES